MAKKRSYNSAMVGLGSLLAIAVISVLVFNVAPVPEPVPSDNVPLGFSALMMIGMAILIFSMWKKQKNK